MTVDELIGLLGRAKNRNASVFLCHPREYYVITKTKDRSRYPTKKDDSKGVFLLFSDPLETEEKGR